MRLWWKRPKSKPNCEVTNSIKALRTLRCIDGRVSISPSEVIDAPGYLEARARAAELIRRRSARPDTADGCDSKLGEVELERFIAQSLAGFREEGMQLDEAIWRLHRLLKNGLW